MASAGQLPWTGPGGGPPRNTCGPCPPGLKEATALHLNLVFAREMACTASHRPAHPGGPSHPGPGVTRAGSGLQAGARRGWLDLVPRPSGHSPLEHGPCSAPAGGKDNPVRSSGSQTCPPADSRWHGSRSGRTAQATCLSPHRQPGLLSTGRVYFPMNNLHLPSLAGPATSLFSDVNTELSALPSASLPWLPCHHPLL